MKTLRPIQAIFLYIIEHNNIYEYVYNVHLDMHLCVSEMQYIWENILSYTNFNIYIYRYI
jgi:hypothetical protein